MDFETEKEILLEDKKIILHKIVYVTYKELLEIITHSKNNSVKIFQKWLADVYTLIEMTGKYDIFEHLEILNEIKQN